VSSAIIPVARALYLCDAATSAGSGKVHLSGVFNAIRAGDFPHAGTRVVAFAQLTGGVGAVPTYVEVRHAGRDETVYRTSPLGLRFPDRITSLQVAVRLSPVYLPVPGGVNGRVFLPQSTRLRHDPSAPRTWGSQ
jgi:hypothetical protein